MKYTHAKFAVTLSVILAAGFAMAGGVQASAATVKTQPVPPDSFLRFRVDTVQQMINQIKADPAVRHRYSQLFNVPSSKLVAYIQKNVVESYVPATKTYRVWCVAKNGKLFAINARFVAGTRVFALRNGTPVMKWACGNPVISALPAPPETPLKVAKAPTSPTEKVANYTDVIPTEMVAPAPVETVATATASDVESVVPQTMVASSNEYIGTVPAQAAGGVVPWIPLAGAAGLVTGSIGGSAASRIVALGGGFGGGGGIGGGIAPEPAPAVTLLFGLLPLAGLVALARRTSLKGSRIQA
jgi:hypothetical protein